MTEDFLDESFDPTNPDELLNDLDDRIDAAWLERDYASVAHLSTAAAHVVDVVNEQNGRDVLMILDTAAASIDLTGEPADLAELTTELRQASPLPADWFLPAGLPTAERLDLLESQIGDLRDLLRHLSDDDDDPDLGPDAV